MQYTYEGPARSRLSPAGPPLDVAATSARTRRRPPRRRAPPHTHTSSSSSSSSSGSVRRCDPVACACVARKCSWGRSWEQQRGGAVRPQRWWWWWWCDGWMPRSPTQARSRPHITAASTGTAAAKSAAAAAVPTWATNRSPEIARDRATTLSGTVRVKQ